MRDFWRALKLATSQKKLTTYAVGSSLGITILEILQPLVFSKFFNLIDISLRTGLSDELKLNFIITISLYSLLIIVRDFGNSISYFAIATWWNKTKQYLSSKVFRHLETLSLKYFENNTTGKIKERVDKGINDLNNIIEGVMVEIMPQVIFIFVAIIILMRTNYIFGLILLVNIPVFIGVSLIYGPKLIKIQDSVRDSYEKLSGITTESIINIKTIKSYATEEKHFRKFSKQLIDIIKKDLEYVKTRISMNIFRFLIVDCVQLIIIGLGVYWTLTGKITLGTFTLAWQYTSRSIQPLWHLTRLYDNMQRDMRSVRRVFELLDTKAEVIDKKNAKSLNVSSGIISFKNITFSYKEKDVIKNLSLDIPGGKVLAIVGKSGSGKSTLVKLLSRFYEVQKGNITVDGQNINDVTQKSLRQNIGVVLQDSILFNDSVSNNISYSKSKTANNEVFEAAKKANALEFIEKLPNRFETIVGERGVKLSGGEQQRINIARAILKNPPILVLDEATSSLDSESEQLIQEALWKLIKGRTTIIIAHRLSTVMKADLIVVMDKGKIVEQGTHKDLVEHKGIYSKLFEIQSGGYLK